MIRTPGRRKEVHTPPPARDLDDRPWVTARHPREQIGEFPSQLPVVHPHRVELDASLAELDAETAYTWRKSSYSDSGGGNCLEISPCGDGDPHTVHIRDSKVPDGPEVTVSPTTWTTFLQHAMK